MSDNFFGGLNLGDDIYSGGNLLVAHENGNIEGSFVLHFILANFIKKHANCARTILVLTKDTTSHWNAISSKLGWNLNSQIGSNVAVLDLSRQLYTVTRNNTIMEPDNPQQSQLEKDKVQMVNLNGRFNLTKILEYCQTTVTEMQSDSQNLKFLLVLDDVTNLSLGVMNQNDCSSQEKSEKDTMNFIRNLLGITDVCVATLTRSPGGNLSKALAHVCSNTLFEVSPLHTGYSQLFSGYLTLTRRPLDASSPSSKSEAFTKPFQFKLEERQIHFSPLTKIYF